MKIARFGRLASAILMFSGLGTAIPAHAFLIAGDDFSGSYVAASNVFGQSSTTSYGFPGSWTGANSNIIEPYAATLTVSGLSNTGLALKLQPTNNQSRSNSHAFTAASGQGTLWFSSAFKPDSSTLTNGADEVMLGFTSGAGTINNAATGTGALWSSSNGQTVQGFQWGVNSTGTLSVKYQSDADGSGAVTLSNTGFTLTANATYFLVGEVLVNASGNTDTLNVWVLTSAPASSASLGAPTFTVDTDLLTDSSSLDNLLATAGVSNTGTGVSYFDAVHMGTTYSDVTAAVPEAPAWAMLLGGGIAFLGFRPSARRAVGLPR